jgi:hypothetical protein
MSLISTSTSTSGCEPRKPDPAADLLARALLNALLADPEALRLLSAALAAVAETEPDARPAAYTVEGLAATLASAPAWCATRSPVGTAGRQAWRALADRAGRRRRLDADDEPPASRGSRGAVPPSAVGCRSTTPSPAWSGRSIRGHERSSQGL